MPTAALQWLPQRPAALTSSPRGEALRLKITFFALLMAAVGGHVATIYAKINEVMAVFASPTLPIFRYIHSIVKESV